MSNKDKEFYEELSKMRVNIYKSLAAFQQECPVIHKGSKAHSYSYADLPSIFEVINPLLQKHGLGFTQLIEGSFIKTILFHTETGETIESMTEIPLIELRGMNAYQAFGSGITYYRRYALSAMLGIVTDVDNDAQGKQESKPLLTADRFAKSLKAIKEGSYDAESLKKNFSLTPEQLKQLDA